MHYRYVIQFVQTICAIYLIQLRKKGESDIIEPIRPQWLTTDTQKTLRNWNWQISIEQTIRLVYLLF